MNELSPFFATSAIVYNVIFTIIMVVLICAFFHVQWCKTLLKKSTNFITVIMGTWYFCLGFLLELGLLLSSKDLIQFSVIFLTIITVFGGIMLFALFIGFVLIPYLGKLHNEIGKRKGI